MRRLHKHKSRLRGLMLALVGLVAAGLLLAAQGASAAPSAAPELLSTPDNPNTTNARSSFTYTVGDGETSTQELTFYCRRYATVSPPSASSGWGSCGRSTDAQPLTKVYDKTIAGAPELSNGDWTFEVAAREGSSINDQGPIASYAWTQDLDVPAKAPIFTSTPPDPQTEQPNQVFTFTPSEDENDLVNLFQCRLDSSEESDWQSCGLVFGTRTITVLNGEHTLEVRAGNISGYGPAAAYTWTTDIPDAHPSVFLDDVAATEWYGSVAQSKLGALQSTPGNLRGPIPLDDVNGDEVNDLAIASYASADKGVYVVFGSRLGRGDLPISGLRPDEGYKIQLPAAMNQSSTSYDNVGDQNGDGIDDLVIRAAPSLFGQIRMFVVYSVSDPSSLPVCAGSTVSRCLALDSLTDAQGYELRSVGTSGNRAGNRGVSAAGDFDGDGVDDILVLAQAASTNGQQSAWIVRGGQHTGVTLIESASPEDVLEIKGVTGTEFGTNGRTVGDLNGDGKDDLAVTAIASGLTYIVDGFDWTESPYDIADFSEQDGLEVFGPAAEFPVFENLGDINGDGRADLGVRTQESATGSTDHPFTVLYTPEQPADPLIFGFDAIPGTGYVVDHGESGELRSFAETLDNLGDLNNDGVPDQVISASDTTVDGLAEVGAAYVIFGQRSPQADLLNVGPHLTPELGLALLQSPTDHLLTGASAQTVQSLGDLDGDGLPDLSVGSDTTQVDGNLNAGSVRIIYGKSLINQVRTGDAVSIENESAQLKAPVQINGRDTEVWFEYGTSDEYGEISVSQEFEASNSGDSAVIGIDGLEKNTTYHYRAVAKNALGLVRYGDDMTFTTTNAVDPPPPSNCDTDNTLPGCPGYDHCKVHPEDCTGGPTNAKLAVVTITKKLAVKRGKKGTVQVAVINTGGKAAKGVKVCVKGPKKLVKVKGCTKVGSLGSGASRTVKIKVKAKRKRGKAVLKLTAKGNGLSANKATAKVVIR